MQQHTEGMVGSIIWILLEIYFSFQQWKNFENPLSYRHEWTICCLCARSKTSTTSTHNVAVTAGVGVSPYHAPTRVSVELRTLQSEAKDAVSI